MDILDKENKKYYLLGDFNIDLLKIDEDTHSSTFFDTMTSNLFVPHIIHPTRITSTTKTLIDNIFSNSTNYREGISGNLTVSLSDHLAQFLIIPENCSYSPKKQNQYTRDTKNIDYVNLIQDLQMIDWQKELKIHKNDPNLSFQVMQAKIDKIINQYLPKRKMTKKEIKQRLKPWISNRILKMIQLRDKIHKKFIKAKNQIIKDLFHEKYKTLRNEIVSLCRQSKKDYYQNYFSNNSNNLRNTWRGIKLIINLNTNGKTNPTSLLINNELTTDPTLIAQEFNNYFSGIAGKLQASIYSQGQNFHDYLHNSSEQSLFIKPTNKYEIIDTINRNITNKSSGPNSIPNDILHLMKHVIAEPLADIINLSFATGIYIDKLKISKVIPIYKEKDSNLLSSNYRPISLLSNINKIFEKIMHNRLYEFLEMNNSIYKNQFGFRKSHSTTHALIDLTEDIREALDNNKFACGVFIDLQKAFDTVDHEILLKKLEHYGIRGIANDWFRSYLKNRKQFVSVSGFESNVANMDYGVPQGSVLGPLLFLLYINDLHLSTKYSKIRHFADDTNFLINNRSLKQLKKHLNHDLHQLCNWLKANKISLNSGKTELMIFRHPNKQLNYDLKVKINGKKLLPSKSVKYLGIILDPHLNWSFHVDSISPKLSRAAGMLSKIRHYVSETTLRSVYFGIFSSLLTYGAQVWGQFSNKYILRLQSLQNKAIRIINFAKYRDPVLPLYYKSHILKLSDYVKLLNFTYVHDSINRTLPEALQNSFQVASVIHSHDTRDSSQCNTQFKMSLPKARTQVFGVNSIRYQSVASWNVIMDKLPQEKLQVKKKLTCKQIIKKHLLDGYTQS